MLNRFLLGRRGDLFGGLEGLGGGAEVRLEALDLAFKPVFCLRQLRMARRCGGQVLLEGCRDLIGSSERGGGGREGLVGGAKLFC